MTNSNPSVLGSRLLALRRDRALSLRSLARKAGLSVNAVSRIEREKSSPTVASLQRLATALGVPITEFFKVEPAHSSILVKENERMRTGGDGVLVESLGTGLSGQHLGAFLMTFQTGASGADRAITHGGEEFVYCVEGVIDYRVGDTSYRMDAGDSLIFLPSQPHMASNPGPETAVVLVVILVPEEEVQSTHQQHLMLGSL